MSKAYPCGAGLGLLGVSTDGDVALCHRFAGSDAHKLGTVRDGIDRRAQQIAFLEHNHIADKTDCSNVLGAAALLGRLLPRSARALRHDDAPEPALLRVDSRLDRHVPARSTASCRNETRRFWRDSIETKSKPRQ